VLGRVAGREVYRLNDSVNDVSMGIIEQVGGAFLKTLVFAAYLWVWSRWRVNGYGRSARPGCGSPVVGVGHVLPRPGPPVITGRNRTSHMMNLGWATHIATTRVKSSTSPWPCGKECFKGSSSGSSTCRSHWSGFPPAIFLAVVQFNALYQFWIHTRLIGKLGPIEWVFNTPSHHRVHHACDAKYIDKNHGGTLIIWEPTLRHIQGRRGGAQVWRGDTAKELEPFVGPGFTTS